MGARTPSGDTDCRKEINRLLSLAPDQIERAVLYHQLAEAYLSCGDIAIAKDVISKALHPVERPDHVPSLLLASRVCAQKAEWRLEALSFAKKALEKAEGEYEGYKSEANHVLGVIYFLQGRSECCASKREELLKRAGSCMSECLGKGESIKLADAKFDMALLLAEQRQIVMAKKIAREALALSEGQQNGDTWRLLVLLLTAQQRIGDALGLCDAAVEAVGVRDGVYNLSAVVTILEVKARILMGEGKLEDALEVYKQILIACKHGDKIDCHRNFVGGKEKWKLEAVAWVGLADVYCSLSLFKDADACLEKLRELDVYSAATWHATGLVHEAKEDVVAAARAYESALAVNPSHGPSRVNLGVLLYKRGGSFLALAESHLKGALAENPTDIVALHHLGLIAKSWGQRAKAIELFEAVIGFQASAPIIPFSSIAPSICRLSWVK